MRNPHPFVIENRVEGVSLDGCTRVLLLGDVLFKQ